MACFVIWGDFSLSDYTDVSSPYVTYNTDKKDGLIHFTYYKA